MKISLVLYMTYLQFTIYYNILYFYIIIIKILYVTKLLLPYNTSFVELPFIKKKKILKSERKAKRNKKKSYLNL